MRGLPPPSRPSEPRQAERAGLDAPPWLVVLLGRAGRGLGRLVLAEPESSLPESGCDGEGFGVDVPSERVLLALARGVLGRVVLAGLLVLLGRCPASCPRRRRRVVRLGDAGTGVERVLGQSVGLARCGVKPHAHQHGGGHGGESYRLARRHVQSRQQRLPRRRVPRTGLARSLRHGLPSPSASSLSLVTQARCLPFSSVVLRRARPTPRRFRARTGRPCAAGAARSARARWARHAPPRTAGPVAAAPPSPRGVRAGTPGAHAQPQRATEEGQQEADQKAAEVGDHERDQREQDRRDTGEDPDCGLEPHGQSEHHQQDADDQRAGTRRRGHPYASVGRAKDSRTGSTTIGQAGQQGQQTRPEGACPSPVPGTFMARSDEAGHAAAVECRRS